MSLFVDTSVWSMAFRRDEPSDTAPVHRLRRALTAREDVYTTGIVLQELLQGFRGPKSRDAILDRFSALPLLMPNREDHIGAAEIRNRCRRGGIHLGTIDALLLRLCLRHDLEMLTTDQDFRHASDLLPLRLWRSSEP